MGGWVGVCGCVGECVRGYGWSTYFAVLFSGPMVFFTAQPRSAVFKLGTHILLYVIAIVLQYMVGVGGYLARRVDYFVRGWVVGYFG